MTITDPIADMLTALRNAVAVHKDIVVVPHSKLREAIAKLIQEEGYVRDVRVETNPQTKFLELQVGLKYASNGDSVIQGIRRVSHPGQRIYSSSNRLKKVLSGVGTSVVSTSQGLMTDHQARQQGLGGEVLFKIW
ncbi:MAG: 30S ribosomal protein S8 [Patescibacteria group bacterium]|jgi:small subunit ribosomal protein S8